MRGLRLDGSTSCASGSCRRAGGLPDCRPNPVPPEVTHETVIRYDTRLPLGLNVYALVNFVVALLLAVVLLAAGRSFGRGELGLLAMLVLWALLNVGGIFDHRRWAFPSEMVRLPVTAAVLASRFAGGASLVAGRLGLAVAAVLLMIWLLSLSPPV